VPWLYGIGLIADHGFKNWNSFKKLILSKINQPNVQANTRNLWHQMLGFLERFHCLRPLLTPHINHAKVSVGPADLRIERNHFPKIILCLG